jgi:predicted nucleic acid-binding protein
MTSTLIDSNVLIDIFKRDQVWLDWSSRQVAASSNQGEVVVNAIVFAEISVGFASHRDLAAMLKLVGVELADIPWEAAFLAGHTHSRYTRVGAARNRTLPDFIMGAHAAVKRFRLLTRDARNYRTYFPELELVTPDTHP